MKNPFIRLFRARDKPGATDSVSSAPTFYFGSSAAGKSVTASTAIQMSTVYACVRVIAETIASLPLHVYQNQGEGSVKALDHPLYPILHDEPNSEMTSFVWRETMLAHLLLWGNAYCQIIRSGRSQILGLYPLLPDRMEVDRDSAGTLTYTYSANSGQTVKLRPEDVLGSDLLVYCRQPGTRLGSSGELFMAPRLDDQACVWGCLQGFLESGGGAHLPVFCLLDNEEVGSATPEGAASTLLRDVLRRIAGALDVDGEGYQMLLSRSLLVSADNAHAIHPTHPELSDRDNAPRLNGGIVLKFSAPRRYATDGGSAAAFRALCRRADVPVQTMANRSDLPGGSTLGSIAGTLVPVSAVDIGLAQLAMHAAVEVMGAEDYPRLIAAMRQFYKE